jgi:hypothetical protein
MPQNHTEKHGSVGQISLRALHPLGDVNLGRIVLFVCVIPCDSVAESLFLGSHKESA